MMPYGASTWAGLIGLFLFVTFFAVVVVMLLRPGSKAEADQNAQIPFKED